MKLMTGNYTANIAGDTKMIKLKKEQPRELNVLYVIVYAVD